MNATPRKKVQLEIVSRRDNSSSTPRSAPPTVSGRWILSAIGIVVIAAVFCAWATLCLLFWQGSWQLLYHPSSRIAQTPAAANLAFEPVGFAATGNGQPRLRGWWIEAAPNAPLSRYTVLYLHGAKGNLGNTIGDLAAIHAAGVNLLAFDYRGYGESEFVRPTESRWKQDAKWALDYLTGTRQISAGAIILVGHDLGANLALEVAAAHPKLAGVVLIAPLASPMKAVFSDPRAQLVPAHLLARDSYAIQKPAEELRIPSLWVFQESSSPDYAAEHSIINAAYNTITAPKQSAWLTGGQNSGNELTADLTNWLTGLNASR